MSFTYTQLKTAIQDYVESTETSLVSNLNNFIETAEERILKNVQLDEFRKNVEGEVTTSSPYLTTPEEFFGTI